MDSLFFNNPLVTFTVMEPSAPPQIVGSTSAVMDTSGSGRTVTVTLASSVQPPPLPTLRVTLLVTTVVASLLL
jgi:hypothetical protein